MARPLLSGVVLYIREGRATGLLRDKLTGTVRLQAKTAWHPARGIGAGGEAAPEGTSNAQPRKARRPQADAPKKGLND